MDNIDKGLITLAICVSLAFVVVFFAITESDFKRFEYVSECTVLDEKMDKVIALLEAQK